MTREKTEELRKKGAGKRLERQIKRNRDKETCREMKEEKVGTRSKAERRGRKERKKEGGVEKDRDKEQDIQTEREKEGQGTEQGTEK